MNTSITVEEVELTLKRALAYDFTESLVQGYQVQPGLAGYGVND
jgi:hypothetical protein